MKISWTSFKVSIAGAKLSHLVQKDKIWDHGSMIEQVKTIFFKVQRIKNSGNVEDIKKYVTDNCFEKLKKELETLDKKRKTWMIKNPVIKEVSVIEVHAAKKEKPDSFTALIKGKGIFFITDKNSEQAVLEMAEHIHEFSEHWSFTRQGDWWLLDQVK